MITVLSIYRWTGASSHLQKPQVFQNASLISHSIPLNCNVHCCHLILFFELIELTSISQRDFYPSVLLYGLTNSFLVPILIRFFFVVYFFYGVISFIIIGPFRLYAANQKTNEQNKQSNQKEKYPIEKDKKNNTK